MLRGTTDSVYRIQYDTASMQYLTIDGLGPFVTSVVTLLAMFLCDVSYRSAVGFSCDGYFPYPFLCFPWRIGRSFASGRKEVKQLESSAMGVLQEVLSAVRVV